MFPSGTVVTSCLTDNSVSQKYIVVPPGVTECYLIWMLPDDFWNEKYMLSTFQSGKTKKREERLLGQVQSKSSLTILVLEVIIALNMPI